MLKSQSGRYGRSSVMTDFIPTESCRRCAQCCKNVPFVELSTLEIELLEQVTGLPFDVFTHAKRTVIEAYFLQFKANGDCFFLNESNGLYACGVYDARPDVCRRFPSTPIQKEACQHYLEIFFD